jgi:hypothetical protein
MSAAQKAGNPAEPQVHFVISVVLVSGSPAKQPPLPCPLGEPGPTQIGQIERGDLFVAAVGVMRKHQRYAQLVANFAHACQELTRDHHIACVTAWHGLVGRGGLDR